jgi:hypothetical protein
MSLVAATSPPTRMAEYAACFSLGRFGLIRALKPDEYWRVPAIPFAAWNGPHPDRFFSGGEEHALFIG